MCFVVEDGCIALNRFRGEQLSSDPAMLSPCGGTSASRFIKVVVHNGPSVVIWGCSKGPSAKYRLVLHEIWLATGENGAVGNQKILCDARIRDHNEQLIPHPDGKQWPISSCPRSQRPLRITAKESISQQRTGGDRMSVFID